MGKIFLLLLYMASVFPYSVNGQAKIRIMSYNIRYDNPSDADQGNGWVQRRENLLQLIKHYDPDLLGVQEALKNQLDYLLGQLEGYDYIGVGRDDGAEQGEYSAILYKKSKLKLIEGNTFWLSETPEKPSKAWDAALPRVVTWGEFMLKSKNQHFDYFNTHFDHVGTEARANSAKLIVQKVNALGEKIPVIVSGDFNATPLTEPYEILTSALKDGREESLTPAYGPEGTFSGFELVRDSDFFRIDYIFVKNVEVETHETVADFFNNKFPSDHLPVVVDLILNGD